MIVLGNRYKDSVTGFEGTAVSVCHYLHGQSQVQIAPDYVKGQPANQPQWFCEEQLENVSPTQD